MSLGEAMALGLRCAVAGVPAFPIAISWDEGKEATNKRPLTANGFLDASTDERQVRLMFNKARLRPGEVYGVGVWPGRAGYVVLDVDVKGGARGFDELEALEEEHGRLPDTATATTPSGGAHIWFRKRSTDGEIGNADLVPRHIETRADSGFVVAPGTWSPWGSCEWEDGCDVFAGGLVAELPEWVAQRLDVRSASSSGGSVPSSKWTKDLDRSTLDEGTRLALESLEVLGGTYSHRSGDVLHVRRPDKRGGASATIGAVAPGVVKVFTPNWSPLRSGGRYDADHLEAVARAWAAGDKAEAKRLADEDDLDRLMAPITGQPADGPAAAEVEPGAPASVRFRRWSITELLDADLSYQWDATGLLVRPTYGVDTGELKTLKSYIGTARAVGLAGGVPILGHWPVPERRRVLCYVAEGGRIPFTRRLIRLCEAHGIDPHDLDGWLEPIFDAGPLDHVEFRDSLRAHLADFRPGFVHLDPLYPFQPMTVDSNKLSQVGLMLNEVQAICAEHDATFWITAHMNQSGTGFDLKRISGAGVGEWGDSWVLLRHRESADVTRGRFWLTADIGSRQWGGGSFDIDFDIGAFDAEAGTHDGPITFNVRRAGTVEATDAEVAKRLAARRAVFNAMRKARKPLTKSEIAERSTGASNDRIRAAIAEMADAGELIEHGIRKAVKGGRDAALYVLSPSLVEVEPSRPERPRAGTSPGASITHLAGVDPPDLFDAHSPRSEP